MMIASSVIMTVWLLSGEAVTRFADQQTCQRMVDALEAGRPIYARRGVERHTSGSSRSNVRWPIRTCRPEHRVPLRCVHHKPSRSKESARWR